MPILRKDVARIISAQRKSRPKPVEWVLAAMRERRVTDPLKRNLSVPHPFAFFPAKGWETT